MEVRLGPICTCNMSIIFLIISSSSEVVFRSDGLRVNANLDSHHLAGAWPSLIEQIFVILKKENNKPLQQKQGSKVNHIPTK